MTTFIDAACVYGEDKTFSVSLNTYVEEEEEGVTYITHDGQLFEAFDISDYSVIFRVLGSATADAEILLEHTITQDTDIATVGQITDPTNGQFSFALSADETVELGLGKHPIYLALVDADTLEHVYTITEGGDNGEFNKINIIQV